MDIMDVYGGLAKLEIARRNGEIQQDFFRVQMFRELMGLAKDYFDGKLDDAVAAYNDFKTGKTSKPSGTK